MNFLCLQLWSFFGTGQIDRHGRAFVRCADDGDVAASLFGKTIDLAQAQTRALAELLCSEIRLEDPRQVIGCDTRPGIRKTEGDVFAMQTGASRIALQCYR